MRNFTEIFSELQTSCFTDADICLICHNLLRYPPCMYVASSDINEYKGVEYNRVFRLCSKLRCGRSLFIVIRDGLSFQLLFCRHIQNLTSLMINETLSYALRCGGSYRRKIQTKFLYRYQLYHTAFVHIFYVCICGVIYCCIPFIAFVTLCYLCYVVSFQPR